MDPSQPNLESILAALAAQRQTGATPGGSAPPPGTAPPGYPGAPHPSYAGQAPPSAYQQTPPGQYQYPQPTASGSLDLSSIKPVNSGTVSIADAIAQAKAFAASKGVQPYEQQQSTGYASNEPRGGGGGGGGNPNENRSYGRRSRSRSPPRREAFRDNFNPYRDERREGRGDNFRRDRSNSPAPRGGGRQGFSPRGGNGAPSGRNRSPLRGDDEGIESMQIEASLVGLIIGRQGENLRRVEAESHCRVQFISATSPGDPFRMCKITGPRARRAEAKAAITRIIEDSGMSAGARGGGSDKGGPRDGGGRYGGGGGGGGGGSQADSNQTPALKEGEDLVQIMVPDRTVGLIIGRGGETIRDLQERSGCHVNIVGENKSVNGLRPVNLIGSPAAAMLAKDLIMEIVDSDSRNANNPGGRDGGGGGGHRHGGRPDMRDGGGGGEKLSDSVYVPSEAVGMIIGKGGEAIKEMQSITGCKINVSQSSGPGETEREIGLVGSREAIQLAKQAIEEKVEASRNKSSGGRGGGRGGGGYGGHGGHGGQQHRDYDASGSGYGQQAAHSQGGAPPGAQQPPAGAGGADPYAAYGGYQAYLAMWYQAIAAQQGQGGQGDASQQPPGT